MIKLIDFASGMTLGDRNKALVVRSMIYEELAVSNNKIIIDFGGNLVVTQSFIDELFGVLVLQEGREVITRFSFLNISEKNKTILKFVVNFRSKQTLA